MKKNVKLFGCSLIVLFAMVACEKDVVDPATEAVELKKAANGMIKSYSNTMVLQWDELLSKAIDQTMPPPAEGKIYAMFSLAVHDALNFVVPRYETYALDNSNVYYKDISKKNISAIADAAVAQAAHDVIVALVPSQAVNADVMLEANLAGIEASEFKDRGIHAGMESAKAIFAKRQADVSFGFAPYPVGTLPGEYRPTFPGSVAYGATVPQLKPFGMTSADHFRAEPPMALNSLQYSANYNEVKNIGSSGSTVRTQEQTEIGLFCLDNVNNSMNRIIRFLAVQENLDGWETARLLALTEMAVMDANISSFDGKYFYNRWRPVTAIAEGENDGNNETAGLQGWAPFVFTPATPTYPSTHAESGGAGTEMLKLFFNTDKKSFSIGSYSLPGVTRTYSSFSAFSSELAVSRVYIGIHFRNDVEQGEKMGKELAKFIYVSKLRELK